MRQLVLSLKRELRASVVELAAGARRSTPSPVFLLEKALSVRQRDLARGLDGCRGTDRRTAAVVVRRSDQNESARGQII